jgi:hypothetical protein
VNSVSDSGSDFVRVKSEMKAEAANQSISQNCENPGKPKLVGIPHCNFPKNSVT